MAPSIHDSELKSPVLMELYCACGFDETSLYVPYQSIFQDNNVQSSKRKVGLLLSRVDILTQIETQITILNQVIT